MWSKLSGDEWNPAREISGASAWMPDAAADSKGNLYVAWDSYRTGNYDIFVRRIGADGGMGPVEQVTKSPRFQAHASVAVDGNDRLWLAWQRIRGKLGQGLRPRRSMARNHAVCGSPSAGGCARERQVVGSRGVTRWPRCRCATTALWKLQNSRATRRGGSGWRSRSESRLP